MDTELVENYDYLCKAIILGESGTGKTSLVQRHLNDTFKQNVGHTIGVTFQSTVLRLPSTLNAGQMRTLKLQLWDTAGQERFRSVSRQYYRQAAGVLLCYDISRRATFDTLSDWLADARSLASPDAFFVLVGCKSDRDDDREVPWLEASRFAKDESMLFCEVSSLTGAHVDDAFTLLARPVLQSVESGRIVPGRDSGVTFGERALRRQSSWSSYRPPRTFLERASDTAKGCC